MTEHSGVLTDDWTQRSTDRWLNTAEYWPMTEHNGVLTDDSTQRSTNRWLNTAEYWPMTEHSGVLTDDSTQRSTDRWLNTTEYWPMTEHNGVLTDDSTQRSTDRWLNTTEYWPMTQHTPQIYCYTDEPHSCVLFHTPSTSCTKAVKQTSQDISFYDRPVFAETATGHARAHTVTSLCRASSSGWLPAGNSVFLHLYLRNSANYFLK